MRSAQAAADPSYMRHVMALRVPVRPQEA